MSDLHALSSHPWSGVFLTFFGFLLFTQIAFIAALCLRIALQRDKDAPRMQPSLPSDGAWPWVSVIVPAFNEEKVVAATIYSLLKNDYPHLEIIAVDDGSQDDTAKVINTIAATDARVKSIILQRNSGKAHALNTGIAEARSEYIVIVDADTIAESDFIRQVVAPLVDGQADAVAGNIKVGNRRCIKTIFQSLEYTCSLNNNKAFQKSCRIINTLPGAGSAFKKYTVHAAGGFASSTRAEDCDLTLKLAQRNFRISYQPLAVVHTEAPTTWHALFRQRRRWIYGNMQCAGLHRRQMNALSPMSVVGMPLFIFDNLLKIPLIFFFIIFPLGFLGDTALPSILLCYGLSMLLYWISSALIYWHEREMKTELLYLPLKSLVWPIFSMTAYSAALWYYLRRRSIEWQKLERTGEVASSAGAMPAIAHSDNARRHPDKVSLSLVDIEKN